MAVQADTLGQPATAGQNWYARSPEQVAADLGVESAAGLSAARAALGKISGMLAATAVEESPLTKEMNRKHPVG